jgi:nucleoside-diphosphate-sugar epimerase
LYSKNERDLLIISDRLEKISQHIRGKSIQVIGATGFVGRWILESLIFYNERFNLNISIHQVGRKPIHELISHSNFHEFDFSKQLVPKIETDFVVFASTPSQHSTGGEDKTLVYSSINFGLRTIINKILASDHKTRFFNCSSGTVLYPNNLGITNLFQLPENELGNLQLSEVYKASKILSEEIVNRANISKNFFGINGRLWTFYGLGIPLDAHFAIGNFMSNAINGLDVEVKGNPRTVRSYLYPIDMVVRIIQSTVIGTERELSIGSQSTISIGRLAELISTEFGSKQVQFCENNDIETNYYPRRSDSSNEPSVPESIDLLTGLHYWFNDLKFGKLR